MSKLRVVYQNPNGSISVIVPADRARLENESDEDFIRRIVAKALPAGVSEVHVCTEDDLPKDRTFRSAWVKQGKFIDVHMPKARELHMQRIRLRRNELLAATDGEMARANETGNGIEAMKSRRQRLRDVPGELQARVDGAMSPEELKAITHEALS